eukprot:6472994-Karenia_brevis.AAC.1
MNSVHGHYFHQCGSNLGNTSLLAIGGRTIAKCFTLQFTLYLFHYGQTDSHLECCITKSKKIKGGAPDVSDMANFSPGGRVQTTLSGDTKVYVDVNFCCSNGCMVTSSRRMP